MKQPHNKIDPKTVERELQNETGLNPKTATKDDIAKGLKLLLGFVQTDEVQVLRAKDDKGKRHVTIAYMHEAQESINRLKAALGDLPEAISTGSASVTRKSVVYGTMRVGANTLELDIDSAKRGQLREALATFVNAEAALQDKEAGTTQLMTLVSAIQQPEERRHLR